MKDLVVKSRMIEKSLFSSAGVFLLSLLVACFIATVGALAQNRDSEGADLTEEESLFSEEEEEDLSIWDPIEPFNRGVFWFNDTLDVYLFEPVARGYDYVAPDSVQRGVTNFFRNLSYPVYLLSDLVQLKFEQAGEHTGRFLINSTVGLVGIFDVATDVGLHYHPEDFGTALAYYGVPSGPYLVLPILGPSNFRDFLGTTVDSFLSPTAAIGYSDMSSDEKFWSIAALNTVSVVNTRASLLEAVESGKEASLDYYLFMQSAYEQYRRGVVEDRSFDRGAVRVETSMEEETFGEE